MFAGRIMPCQWMEVSCFKRLRTRSVTVSPSRQRRMGPGSEPLMAMAVRAAPVKLTGRSAIYRSNSVPVSTLGWPGLVTAQTGVRHMPNPPSSPVAARPLTKDRLVVLLCMPLRPVSHIVADVRAIGSASLVPRALALSRLTIGRQRCQKTECNITDLSGVGGQHQDLAQGRAKCPGFALRASMPTMQQSALAASPASPGAGSARH